MSDIPQDTIDCAVKLYGELGSAVKVGAAMGISDWTVRKYLDRAGVPRDMHLRPRDATGDYRHYNNAPPDLFGRLILPTLPDVVLCIPDTQAPYHHQDALPFLAAVAERYRPDAVVGIGDEVDFGFLSRFDKFPEIDAPAHELANAKAFLDGLFRLFPRAHALTSNHVHGRLQSARRVGRLPPAMMVPWRDLIRAPAGWEWYEEVHLGDVLFRHGDKWPKLTTNHLARDVPRCYGRHMSVVHGHLHSQHGRVGDTVLVGDNEYWAAYTGCLIDVRSKAFDYVKAPQNRLGCLVIVHGVPHRVPLRRDDRGRWIGRL